MNALGTLVREQLGPWGVTALVVLAASLLFLAFAVQPLERRDRVLDLALQGHDGAMDRSARSGAPDTRIAVFYAFFERRETLPDWLARIQQAGMRAGLRLPSASYDSTDGGQRLTRYRVTVPLTGTYVQIRRFLANVLDDVPIASLDHVSFQRAMPNAPQVDAEATFTLYLIKR